MIFSSTSLLKIKLGFEEEMQSLASLKAKGLVLKLALARLSILNPHMVKKIQQFL
jgi:hypothetical protein